MKLADAEVDNTLHTSAVPAGSQRSVDRARISDEATIRNAVSAADIESLRGAPLAWANSVTGARGVISGLAEQKDSGLLCRDFTTTRESFDGVALFRGEACTAGAGAWRLQKFEAL